MTMITVVDDCEPVELDCARCKADGRIGDMWCSDCGGTGADFFSRSELYTLAHNLAIAGALCESFQLGDQWGAWTEDPYPDPAPWRPGCHRSAR
jgi:hypothetical protein